MQCLLDFSASSVAPSSPSLSELNSSPSLSHNHLGGLLVIGISNIWVYAPEAISIFISEVPLFSQAPGSSISWFTCPWTSQTELRLKHKNLHLWSDIINYQWPLSLIHSVLPDGTSVQPVAQSENWALSLTVDVFWSPILIGLISILIPSTICLNTPQLLHLNRFLEFSWQGHLLNLLQILKEVSHLSQNEDSSSDHVVALHKFWVPVLASVSSYANLPFTQHGQSLARLSKYAHPLHPLIFLRTDALAGHILLSCHSQLDQFRSSFRPHLPSLFTLNQGILGCFWNIINF